MEEFFFALLLTGKIDVMQLTHPVKFGLMAGIGTVAFLLLFYWIDRRLILSPEIIWSTNLLYLIGMFMSARETRRLNGGTLPFRPALRSAFVVYLVANAIYYGYNFLLYNVIDPDMLNVQQQYMRDNMDQLTGFLGEDNVQYVEQTIDQLNYRPLTVLLNYGSSLIGGFVLAALIGWMVRRKPLPEQ